MDLKRRTILIYGLIAALWTLVVAWQVQEHQRVESSSRANLRNRSKDIANTLGAFIRGLQFRGAIFGDRLQPVLNELVSGRTNELFSSAEVLSVALLNAAGEKVASAGGLSDVAQNEIVQEGERWGQRALTIVYPIEGASVAQEGTTNSLGLIVVPPLTNAGPRGFRGRPGEGPPGADDGPPPPNPNFNPPPPDRADTTNATDRSRQFRPPPAGDRRPGRPFWARRLDDQEYQSLIAKRELHGLVLAMSTDTYRAVVNRDVWMRWIIGFFATVAAVGSGLAWRTLSKSAELQIRLIRASELNTHLKEMNLAAAGLAHETRNPLNIIRGLAQMISKREDTSTEVQKKSREIVDEADKVAAQLNEFINYARPREVRRTPLPLGSVITEVVRALNYDLEEKNVKLHIAGEQLTIEADEQLLRQALFNLLLNSTQAVDGNGEIQVVAQRTSNSEAALDIRDNGPGVPPERRTEIFKPYFTTHTRGTGLGLAVVQQIVLAHGWEIECLANQPKGATFRITHLKLAG